MSFADIISDASKLVDAAASAAIKGAQSYEAVRNAWDPPDPPKPADPTTPGSASAGFISTLNPGQWVAIGASVVLIVVLVKAK
jgi:hypothetical protein